MVLGLVGLWLAFSGRGRAVTAGLPCTWRPSAALTSLTSSNLAVRAPITQPRKPRPPELSLQQCPWGWWGAVGRIPSCRPSDCCSQPPPTPVCTKT